MHSTKETRKPRQDEMKRKDRLVFETFAKTLREEYPVAKVWAFGSRVRGDATAESDFDICIVLEHVGSADETRIREIAWEVAFDNGTVLNTIILSTEDFEQGPMSESTLVADILREGVPA
jgi:predicted nucleotidyltransferase